VDVDEDEDVDILLSLLDGSVNSSRSIWATGVEWSVSRGAWQEDFY